ncbi:MAG TPA: LuxR C-terminal-related transcriptional regulator [Actinokineospora sp.]|jgi:DNA-binding CsgD family transcriptional regulator|nr:LuxR C-terminal-related transcriptional regulator [Actinokineospora sp.]
MTINLPERELQVLRGISFGMPNAEIARSLHLAENTIKTYTQRLFRGLNARDRAHAVRIGFELGLLTTGPVPPDEATEPDPDPGEPAAPPLLPLPQAPPPPEACHGTDFDDFHVRDSERPESYLKRMERFAVAYCLLCEMRGGCWAKGYIGKEWGVWGGALHAPEKAPVDLLPRSAWRAAA